MGKSGGFTDLKLCAAILMLGEGRTAFSVGLKPNMSERQVNKCLKFFSRVIVEQYEDEWLRLPRNSELCDIEERYQKLGFPGCMERVDCAVWD